MTPGGSVLTLWSSFSGCSVRAIQIKHIHERHRQSNRQMCVSSLSCLTTLKRTARGATLNILVPQPPPTITCYTPVTLRLQTANGTLCFQPSVRMDAEAEEPVCLQTRVCVPQDLLDPAVRQVSWRPSSTAQPEYRFFLKNPSFWSFSLLPHSFFASASPLCRLRLCS